MPIPRLRYGDPSDIPELHRQLLTPVAESLGLDYDDAHLVPAATPARRVFEFMSIGCGLLGAFAYQEGWPENLKGRDVAHLKRVVQASMMTDDGRHAAALAGVNYARISIEHSRRLVADAGPDEDLVQLPERAAFALQIAQDTEATFPIPDLDHRLVGVTDAMRIRTGAPGDPTAHTASWLMCEIARATAEMLTIAGRQEQDRFDGVAYGMVILTPSGFLAGVKADWAHFARQFRNVIGPDPVSYGELTEHVAAEYEPRSDY